MLQQHEWASLLLLPFLLLTKPPIKVVTTPLRLRPLPTGPGRAERGAGR